MARRHSNSNQRPGQRSNRQFARAANDAHTAFRRRLSLAGIQPGEPSPTVVVGELPPQPPFTADFTDEFDT